MGVPIVAWEDGKIVKVSPEEIKLLDGTNRQTNEPDVFP